MTNFTEIKRRCIDRFFSRSNPRQKEAIYRTEGALLIIAGAGSGKTSVLCSRIANLLLFGKSYNTEFSRELSPKEEEFLIAYSEGKIDNSPETAAELSRLLSCEKAAPWRIMAVTFTNKAAQELKTRLASMNVPKADEVLAGTFHSVCVKILRRGIKELGYSSSFTIYDTDDSLRAVKEAMKELNISDKLYQPREIQNKISRAKDRLIAPDEFEVTTDGGKTDPKLEATKRVYVRYQQRLKAANALDFDDIIMKTVELFERSPEILARWSGSLDYIMVDEYQDTNEAQFKLISLLSAGSGNLAAVGDEDQSIYKFRGATIENILSFESRFKAHVVKLEQNYRSTGVILDAANSVIQNNTQRKGKNLWSELGEGEKIKLMLFSNEIDEADFVGKTVMDLKEQGESFNANAVLYRTNAQSRTLELSLSRMGVPYRIIGGTKFYERKEIKDILAYLSVINNPFDNLRLSRIINEPKRGIGDATQAEVFRIAEGLGISPMEVMERSEEFETIAKKSKVLEPLARIMKELGKDEDRPLDALIDDIMEMSGYGNMLKAQGDEGAARLENINELKSGAIRFTEENEEHSLSDYLENIALITDLDSYDEGEDNVVLMTMHGAKGLEFDNVFIVGAEENIFPSYRSQLDANEIEEERRLAYVAITRAKKRLFITHTKQRLLFGNTQRNRISRFVSEIPENDMDFEDRTRAANIVSSAPKRRAQTGYLQREALHAQAEKMSKRLSEAHRGDLTFESGERINHRVFGEGTVLNVTPMGNDNLLEINFDKSGIKKIMANYAKVEKLD